MSPISVSATSIVLIAHRGRHVVGETSFLSEERSGDVIVLVGVLCLPVDSGAKVDELVEVLMGGTIDPVSSTMSKEPL